MNELGVNDRIRELCQQILDEEDPDRVEELIASLRNTLRIQNEEARLRLNYVARHFRGRMEAVSSGEAERLTPGGGKIRAVLDFLGLGAGMRLGGELEG